MVICRIEENMKNREDYTDVPPSFLVAIDGNDKWILFVMDNVIRFESSELEMMKLHPRRDMCQQLEEL